MKLEIVTPVIPPAIGGGAIYTMLLSHHLLDVSDEINIRIVSEAYPGRPKFEKRARDGRLTVERLFPHRAGRSKKTLSSYVLYATAQVIYFRMAQAIRRRNPDICLLHSSFLNSPNALTIALRLIKLSGGRTRFVLDVRDPFVPTLSTVARSVFSAVVYCSQRLEPLIQKRVGEDIRRTYIPMPIVIDPPSDAAILETLKKHNLVNVRFLFCANNLAKEKNTGLLVDAFANLHASMPDLRLVLAGRERFSSATIEDGCRKGHIMLLGTISHHEVLCLMRASALVVNPSTIESPSRTAFEALALKCASLLPPAVPEFETLPEDMISDVRTAESFASQIFRTLSNPPSQPHYPFHLHSPRAIATQYAEFFHSILDIEYQKNT